MSNRKGSPDEARAAALYEEITGNPMTRGHWNIEKSARACARALPDEAP
jgi:hypothetical protein